MYYIVTYALQGLEAGWRGVRHRHGDDPGACDRGHHGRCAEGEGRRRLGGQRLHQAVRRHPRRGRDRQRRRVPIHKPDTQASSPRCAARRPVGPGPQRCPGVGRRRSSRRSATQPGRTGTSGTRRRQRGGARIPAQLHRRVPGRRRGRRRGCPAGGDLPPCPAPRRACPRTASRRPPAAAGAHQRQMPPELRAGIPGAPAEDHEIFAERPSP